MTKIILIGDDLAELHRTFDLALEGHALVYAVGTLQAMARLAEHRDVALVFFDVSSSKIQGLDVLIRIKDHPALGQVPVVIVGADVRMARALEMVGGGGALCQVAKPLRGADVHRILRTSRAR